MATRSADKREFLEEIYSFQRIFYLFLICLHFLGRSALKQEKEEVEESTSKAEARSKLNKALENVEGDIEKEREKRSDTSSESENDENVPAKKTKVKAEKEDSPAVKEMKAPKPIKQSQASYIMKLFDRSVNLAKFTEDTPLYELCRSWMQNAPRLLTPKVEKDSEDPAPAEADEGDVTEMPKVRIRKGAKTFVQRKAEKVNETDFDKIIDSEVWTKEKLLEFHRGRWEEERQKQILNSRSFEEKHFAANLELLDSLFKGNEE